MWRQSALDRGLSVKPGLDHLGHWQTVQTQIRCRRMRHLIRVCTVCLNYMKLRAEWNSHKSPSRAIFPAYTQGQLTHQCCQCFEYYMAAPSKKVPSNISKMCWLRSSCIYAKYHLGLCSPFTHSVVSNDSVGWQWRPWANCPDAQADLGPRCLQMS